VRVRVRVACAGVVVVARMRAVWITARIRAYLCEARANSFARGARRATRCSPRRGVGYMCMNIMVALDARAVASAVVRDAGSIDRGCAPNAR